MMKDTDEELGLGHMLTPGARRYGHLCPQDYV